MSSFNHAILIGNLTKDPELRYTTKGTAVCKFTLAINESYKTEGGEKRESVNFIDITSWGKQAEVVAQYMKKGKPLMVVGSLKQDTWEDKNTKEKKSKIGVTLREFQFVGGRDGADSQPEPRQESRPAPASQPEDEPPMDSSDPVPF